jgi:pre-60S factor REI1
LVVFFELSLRFQQTDFSSRYNLKRRVASLPPLSAEIFNEKVLANKASAAATAAKATFEKSCGPCQKTFYSENSFINHLRSQKHKANAAKQPEAESTDKHDDEVRSMTSSAFSLGDPIESGNGAAKVDPELDSVVEDMKKSTLGSEGADTPKQSHTASVTPQARSGAATPAAAANDTEDAAPPVSCLFCNYVSPKFHLNVEHMGKHHGMFIPEREYIVDLEGLILHLERKIKEIHMCLYCGQTKRNAEGVQTHMLDKGHCMIAFDSEEEMIEIGQFYDFRSTYSDDDDYETEDEEDDEISGAVKPASKLGARRTSKGEDGEEDEGWETDSVSDVPTDEITSVPIDDFSHRYATLAKHRHHSHSDPRPHRNVDGWHSRAHPTPHAVYHDDHELHLPTGRTAGHRSLRKYWRQNLRNYPSAEERAEAHNRLLENGEAEEADEPEANRGRQVAKRSNGEMSMIGVTDAKKKEVGKAEKRERTRQLRASEKQRWGNERRNNNQKHFRVSIDGFRWLDTFAFSCDGWDSIANHIYRIPSFSDCFRPLGSRMLFCCS